MKVVKNLSVLKIWKNICFENWIEIFRMFILCKITNNLQYDVSTR